MVSKTDLKKQYNSDCIVIPSIQIEPIHIYICVCVFRIPFLIIFFIIFHQCKRYVHNHHNTICFEIFCIYIIKKYYFYSETYYIFPQ